MLFRSGHQSTPPPRAARALYYPVELIQTPGRPFERKPEPPAWTSSARASAGASSPSVTGGRGWLRASISGRSWRSSRKGIDSGHAIAWRPAGSAEARRFLGYGVDETTPDQVRAPRTGQLIEVEMRERALGWVLEQQAPAGMVKGTTMARDATPLEANAAVGSIARRDRGESPTSVLSGWQPARAWRRPLRRRDRKHRRYISNPEWVNPPDLEAEITPL